MVLMAVTVYTVALSCNIVHINVLVHLHSTLLYHICTFYFLPNTNTNTTCNSFNHKIHIK